MCSSSRSGAVAAWSFSLEREGVMAARVSISKRRGISVGEK